MPEQAPVCGLLPNEPRAERAPAVNPW